MICRCNTWYRLLASTLVMEIGISAESNMSSLFLWSHSSVALICLYRPVGALHSGVYRMSFTEVDCSTPDRSFIFGAKCFNLGILLRRMVRIYRLLVQSNAVKVLTPPNIAFSLEQRLCSYPVICIYQPCVHGSVAVMHLKSVECNFVTRFSVWNSLYPLFLDA